MPDETTVALAKPALQPSPLQVCYWPTLSGSRTTRLTTVERMFAIDKEIRREEKAKREFF